MNSIIVDLYLVYLDNKIIELKNGITENELEYYSGIRKDVENKYTTAVMRKVLRAMAYTAVRVTKLINQINMKIVNKCFLYWKKKTKWGITSYLYLNKFLESKRLVNIQVSLLVKA